MPGIPVEYPQKEREREREREREKMMSFTTHLAREVALPDARG